MKITPKTLKGFRDFLPNEARKRAYVIEKLKSVFESYGFEPLETPTLEYAEILTGKYGDEGDKLMYRFKDKGDRDVALRYDQTVPLARVVAEYGEKLPMPFKRYQIQTVWRAEKPQKGRYREFLQCDADIFGVNDRVSDGELIALTIDVFKNLGFKKPVAIINDRALYKDIPYKAIVAIDKLEKIGQSGVVDELIRKGYSDKEAKKLLDQVALSRPNENLKTIFKFLDDYGMKENYQFKPTLARSFSYSTGTIWEIIAEGFSSGSLAGCERFDSLVSRFSNQNVPAVGFAIGFDRTVLAMEELRLFPDIKTTTEVLVTVFEKKLLNKSQNITQVLRNAKINTDLYSDPNIKLDKQLKYANKKNIPYVVIIGPEEVVSGKIVLKDMKTGEQFKLSKEELVSKLC